MKLFQHPRRGANAVEFALIMPVFVLLLGGLIEFSWVFFMRSTIVIGIRNGCRDGAVIPPDDSPGPEDIAEETIISHMARYNFDCTSSGSDCSLDIETTGSSPTEVLNCQITIDHESLTGLIPGPEQLTVSTLTLLEIQR